MSVASELGMASIGDTPPEVLDAWPTWQRHHRLLRPIDAGRLREWLQCASVKESDDVLCVLARRAAMDGGRDRDAAVALAWALLPGACLLAKRWIRGTDDIDFVVAEQLWIHARTFAWRSKRKVAANILLDVQRAVLAELGIAAYQSKAERAAAYLVPVADLETIQWRNQDRLSPAQQLHRLLVRAVDRGDITTDDHQFLLTVLDVASEYGPPQGHTRNLEGFSSNDFTELVAARIGLSGRTVRRRLQACIAALQAALPQLVDLFAEAA